MRLFYQTKTQNAQAILRDGFQDSVLETTDNGQILIQGVRLFDDALGWPLGVAIDGNAMLSIEIPEDAISEHELLWADDGIPIKIREFAVRDLQGFPGRRETRRPPTFFVRNPFEPYRYCPADSQYWR